MDVARNFTDTYHGRTLRESQRLRALGYLGEGLMLGGVLFTVMYLFSLAASFDVGPEIWALSFFLLVILAVTARNLWAYRGAASHSQSAADAEWVSVRQWRWTVLTGILIAIGLVGIALQYAAWSEWWYTSDIDFLGYGAIIVGLVLRWFVVSVLSHVPDDDTPQEQA